MAKVPRRTETADVAAQAGAIADTDDARVRYAFELRLVSSRTIIPLAYDSGGVTTSTVTVPVLAALGLGLATVTEAVEHMSRHSIGSLVVNRRDADDEAGLIDVAGIAREVIARNRAPDRVHVYEVMTKPVVAIPPTMLVRYAARQLVTLGLSRALVVDQERNVIGMVTLRDLVIARITD